MALSPTTGWAVLHLFCRLQPDFDANALRKAVSGAEADGYQVVPAALLGHKGDLGLMALGPDVWRLRQFQTDQKLSPTGKLSSASLIALGLGPRTSGTTPNPPPASAETPPAALVPPATPAAPTQTRQMTKPP